jgi:hypothetical protein
MSPVPIGIVCLPYLHVLYLCSSYFMNMVELFYSHLYLPFHWCVHSYIQFKVISEVIVEFSEKQ